MKRVEVVALAVVCVGLMVGCSAETSDTPGLTASPTTSPSPTPTPSPTAEAAGPRDLSDPELGIVFTDFPRDQDQSTADAIQTYMLFETKFWQALSTNTVPPGPWAVASDDSIAWIQAQVGPNAEAGWSMAGTLRTSVTVTSGDDTAMALDVCRNWADTHFVHGPSGETSTNEEAGFTTTSRLTLGLTHVAPTGWKVTSHELVGEC